MIIRRDGQVVIGIRTGGAGLDHIVKVELQAEPRSRTPEIYPFQGRKNHSIETVLTTIISNLEASGETDALNYVKSCVYDGSNTASRYAYEKIIEGICREIEKGVGNDGM